MGIFTSRQRAYVPPMDQANGATNGSPSISTFLGVTGPDRQSLDPNMIPVQSQPKVDGTATGDGRTAVAVNLPGLPDTTYLDSEFAPKVNDFVKYAKDAGFPLNFASAYRGQEKQTEMVQNKEGKMPADKSLHSAGLAVDVDGFDALPEPSKLAVRKAADQAGLSWGGTFGDDRHFFIDPIPGKDRTELIANFAEQVRRAQMGR